MIELIKQYIYIGFSHVIPLAFDHILFMLSLFLYASNIKSVIMQCSVFTVAHSLSLAFTALGFIATNVYIIEPLIAVTILYTAIENIISQKENKTRIIIIFIFGIIHGLGFANALNEIGLPKENFLSALLFFNVGVELGQIMVILLAYLTIFKWFSDKVWYKTRIVYPLSSLIGCLAIYWTFERILKI